MKVAKSELDQLSAMLSAVRRAEETARALLNANDNAAILIDPQGRIMAANDAAAGQLLPAQGNPVGSNLFDILPPDAAKQRRLRVKMVVDSGDFQHFEDQTQGRHFSHRIYPVFDRRGRVVNLAIYSRDITDRKLAEMDRLQKEKLEGVLEMAGAACHEINQPLQSIMGYSELMLREIRNEGPLREHLQQMVHQIDRLRTITQKIMRITTYETMDYTEGMKIIDIHKASKSI